MRKSCDHARRRQRRLNTRLEDRQPKIRTTFWAVATSYELNDKKSAPLTAAESGAGCGLRLGSRRNHFEGNPTDL